MESVKRIRVCPQPGPQTQFLQTCADICIYGGGAGGGKSHGLLLDPVRYRNIPNYCGLIFRRTLSEIKKPGALWDSAENLYALFNSTPAIGALTHHFPSGAKVTFGGMEHEKSKTNYHGAQVAFIGFDEVQTFTESQFVYMFSRLRSETGIKGYIRATCNPEAGSWLLKWIGWWIGANGLPIQERSGVLRWFVRIDNQNIWADTREELFEKYGSDYEPRSFTFIGATVYDNKILLEKDPGYLANLQSLDAVERGRLLEGNWLIKPEPGLYFPRNKIQIVDSCAAIKKECRYWDRAATRPTRESPNPDYTAGVKMALGNDGYIYIRHIYRAQQDANEVQEAILNIAKQDGHQCEIGLEQEPGASGKWEAQYASRKVAGFTSRIYAVSKDKVTRAKPFASQWQAGNVRLVKGEWNDAFLNELENFPSSDWHDDQVDGASGAFNMLFSEGYVAPFNPNDMEFNQVNPWDESYNGL